MPRALMEFLSQAPLLALLILVIVLGAFGAIWKVFNVLYVRPRDDRIEYLKEQNERLESAQAEQAQLQSLDGTPAGVPDRHAESAPLPASPFGKRSDDRSNAVIAKAPSRRIESPPAGYAASPESTGIGKQGSFRLFVSRRDQDGHAVQGLIREIENCGISCLLSNAHPNVARTWSPETRSKLNAMQAMLALVTDDFEEDAFCNQEIGVALGKGVPIIALSVGEAPPPGFISGCKTLRGPIDDPESAASQLFALIMESSGQDDRSILLDGLLDAFLSASSFIDAIALFKLLDSHVTQLDASQEARFVGEFKKNDQLYDCGYLCNYGGKRIKDFLKKSTGRSFDFDGFELSPEKRS